MIHLCQEKNRKHKRKKEKKNKENKKIYKQAGPDRTERNRDHSFSLTLSLVNSHDPGII
jgi:hypothetical protein